MRFTKIQLIWGSADQERLTLDIDQITPETPYVVKSVSGLEPPDVTISIGERVLEGGVYQGRRPTNREIVILLSFQPNYENGEDPSTLRKALYQILTPRLDATLICRFWDHISNYWVQAFCHTKRIESNPFTKDPEVQITLSCLSAYLEEPIYTEPNPATLSGKSTMSITNRGDAPTSLMLTTVLTAATDTYTLTGNSPSQFMKFTYAFLANDKVVIDTTPGNRTATRIRTGVGNLNLMPYLSVDSNWLMLEPGVNSIKSNVTAFTVESLKHIPKHWGF